MEGREDPEVSAQGRRETWGEGGNRRGWHPPLQNEEVESNPQSPGWVLKRHPPNQATLDCCHTVQEVPGLTPWTFKLSENYYKVHWLNQRGPVNSVPLEYLAASQQHRKYLFLHLAQNNTTMHFISFFIYIFSNLINVFIGPHLTVWI